MDFDVTDVTTTEFGVGKEEDGVAYFVVPANPDVQGKLRSMLSLTIERMEASEGGRLYSPAEKHAATEYLIVPAESDLEVAFRTLHEAENLPVDVEALWVPERVLSYFVRFTDGMGRRLTAVRKATQFKGVLGKPLIRVFYDGLQLVQDRVFKLDNDFDLVVDSSHTHIWRPSAFESLGGLNEAILDAVPANVQAIRTQLQFVDFAHIEAYAASRPRAARYLASIRAQQLTGVDRQKLADLCTRTNVRTEDVGGRMAVSAGSEMGFLEVLDRRRYELELIPSVRERFRATSRDRIGA